MSLKSITLFGLCLLALQVSFSLGQTQAAQLQKSLAGLHLTAGDTTLAPYTSPSAHTIGIALRFTAASTPAFISKQPLQATIVNRAYQPETLRGGYKKILRTPAGLRASGTLRSHHGTRLRFVDLYEPNSADGFTLTRHVTVKHVAARDFCFASGFSLTSERPLSMIQAQFLMPGLWYANNKHLPPGAIGANYTDQRIIAREDRLPIPLVALREPSTKTTLTLMHKNPTGESFLGDQTMKPVCSDRLRFSSLGVINKTKHLGVSFLFPGSEGETTYGSKGETTFMGKSHRAWVPRYHRLRRGHKGRYKLLLKLNRSSSFNTALYSALSLGWSILDPAVYPVSLPRVYQEEINLLDHYAQRFNGIMGLPFSVTIPKGKIIDRNLQIGWVGKQALDAYHLIRAGHHERRSSILEKGRAMINFWVENAPYPSNSGLFRTWFETQPKPHWHHSPIYLRAASDGARGVLRAFNADQKAHHPQPAWLKFCKNFGQWLYRHQNPDGSFPRKFSFNTGKVISQSKSATLVPIPFLVNLYRVTGQHRYLKMALNAGRFGQQTFVRNAHFYGGTLDNPNVQDKEAGSLAFAAFLSLYDVTNESRWLKAATAGRQLHCDMDFLLECPHGRQRPAF